MGYEEAWVGIGWQTLIGIIDYGLGNVRAFENIYLGLNIDVCVISNPSQLDPSISKLILPGVGAFDWAMNTFSSSGLRESVENSVMNMGCPILGVCVGMQMLCNSSEEGSEEGLGWVDAEVRRFRPNRASDRFDLPHMGWNDVEVATDSELFKFVDNCPKYYFLHTYYVQLASSKNSIATTTYGESFTSALRLNNIYGTQFHPEKSHHWGIQLLKGFAEI